ncbi:hypothetical protein HAX54_007265 [Datura stramonium]|uniref:Uncharacterized protein n=1 Tax=Datura stramonium TaxID=4076 RepID=A0ABS8TD02_DATST|nr:hypothetical protein [Datura stramonium]
MKVQRAKVVSRWVSKSTSQIARRAKAANFVAAVQRDPPKPPCHHGRNIVRTPIMAPKPSKGKGVASSSHGSKRSKRASEEQNEDVSLPQ